MSAAPTRAQLTARLDAFLAVRKTSKGGYAPVDPKEVEDLGEILSALIKLKYQSDPDGDTPIDYQLIDRTRYQPQHFFMIPYTHDVPVEVMEEAVDLAVTNVVMAASRAEIETKCLRHFRRRLKGAS